jgi:hypothetical protein
MIALALVVIIILIFILEFFLNIGKRSVSGGYDMTEKYEKDFLELVRKPETLELPIGRNLFGDKYTEEEYEAITKMSEHKAVLADITINKLPELTPMLDIHRFKLRLYLEQRGKFITHLNFLSRYSAPGDQVIYVNLTGKHNWLLELCKLFPELTFHIWLFDSAELSGENIKVYSHTDPTPEELKEFRLKPTLLIANNNATPWEDKKYGEITEENMRRNENLVKLISPKYSQLEFKMPYCCIGKDTAQYQYLNGDLEFACWAKEGEYSHSLIVKGNSSSKKYDCELLRRKMAYFRIVVREYFYFSHDIAAEGIDHCFDCMYEINTWKNYLKRGSGEKLNNSELTSKISELITNNMHRYNSLENLATAPHGIRPTEMAFKKKEQLREKYQYEYMARTILRKNTPLTGVTKENINTFVYKPRLFQSTIEQETSEPKEQEAIMQIVGNNDFSITKLSDIDKELKYRNSNDKFVYRRHMGQRKLLMNEILFLVLHGNKATKVVYAGAAPGLHIPWLSKLFPRHKFDLWDPASFAIKETDKISIHQGYFNDEVAEQYRGQKILFISDIRSGSDEMKFEEFEEEVKKNNQWQMDWINIMTPEMSMLKFRIPFNVVGDYEYLQGEIYLQPWAPINSSETRLITDGKTLTTYNSTSYENKMFYFNHVIREFAWFNHNVSTASSPGLCHCYDCTFEIWIWQKYNKSEKVEVNDFIDKTSEYLRYPLAVKHHGIMPEIFMCNKRMLLKQIRRN